MATFAIELVLFLHHTELPFVGKQSIFKKNIKTPFYGQSLYFRIMLLQEIFFSANKDSSFLVGSLLLYFLAMRSCICAAPSTKGNLKLKLLVFYPFSLKINTLLKATKQLARLLMIFH